jgi:hypothetical protein
MSWTDSFVAATESQNLGLHSLMILQDGKTIASRWWKPYAPEKIHQLYSLSKSFTSTAAGLAIAEGRFSLDSPVISFFPEETPSEVSENLAAMRVRDLLSMSSGHTVEPWGEDENWVRGFLAAPIEKQPGTHFLYNSLATYVVSAIVTKVTGESLLDYLRPRLLDPLGITEATWESCPRGIHVGGWGLSITTEAIARFGELYRLDGIWNGVRILPEGWVADATRSHIANGDPNSPSDWTQGYGFQFWRSRHGAYRGDGAFGQFCIVVPDKHLVVAITAGTENMQGVLNALWESLAAGNGEQEPGQTGTTGEIPHPTGESTSPLALDRAFQIEENEAGVTALGVAFDAGGLTLTLTDKWGTHTLLVGLNRWREGVTTYHPARSATQPTAARGAWTAPNVLAFRVCYTEHPAMPLYTLTFEGDTLALERTGSMGIGSKPRLTLTGNSPLPPSCE